MRRKSQDLPLLFLDVTTVDVTEEQLSALIQRLHERNKGRKHSIIPRLPNFSNMKKNSYIKNCYFVKLLLILWRMV